MFIVFLTVIERAFQILKAIFDNIYIFWLQLNQIEQNAISFYSLAHCAKDDIITQAINNNISDVLCNASAYLDYL